METSEDRTNIVWRYCGLPFRHGPVNGRIEDAGPDEEAREEHPASNKSVHALGGAEHQGR